MQDANAPSASEPVDVSFTRAMGMANANAALWAIGNGLISTLLVIYLANDLGANGFSLSLILAAPRFAGLLRLGIPALMARVRARKTVCIVAYVISSIVLCVVPTTAWLQQQIGGRVAIAIFVLAWCLYHITEYVGTVTLWSWLGDLTPANVRGRLLGTRESWLAVGRLGGLIASAGLALLWTWMLPTAPRWEPLALSAAIGAVMMVVAVVPLLFMPGLLRSPSAVPRAPWRNIGRAIVDPAYRRLLLFYFWFSLANGFTATAQERFPISVLNMSYSIRQVLQGLMRAGQSIVAPWAGRLVDRFGSRPIMIVSQLIVSSGLVFFLIATPERPWLIGGAFLVWTAYAGLNVGLDNIKLKLAPVDNNAPFVTIYFAVGDLANGIATVIGGLIYDYLVANKSQANNFFVRLFVLGLVARLLAVPLLVRLKEPGARRLRDVGLGWRPS
jgi:MFS family permease